MAFFSFQPLAWYQTQANNVGYNYFTLQASKKKRSQLSFLEKVVRKGVLSIKSVEETFNRQS